MTDYIAPLWCGVWKRVAPVIASGYNPRPQQQFQWDVVCDDTSDVAGGSSTEVMRPACDYVIFCPTTFDRISPIAQLSTLLAIHDQIVDVVRNRREWRIAFIVGLQSREDDTTQAIEHLRQTMAALPSVNRVRRIAFVMRGRGKTKSLNVALSLATSLGATGILWVDDDVRFNPGCFTAMISAFEHQGQICVVGAKKLGQPKSIFSSRLLFWMKEITRPACDYPHACCILAPVAELKDGIPPRYTSDDGYVCFTFMSRSASEPLARLRIVPDAICYHHVGGPALQTIRRIRRMLLNHIIFMADFQSVAWFYFSRLLFHGLWPLGRVEPGSGWAFIVKKWLLKAVYLGWFALVCAELFVRGIVARPLEEVKWSGYTSYEVPQQR